MALTTNLAVTKLATGELRVSSDQFSGIFDDLEFVPDPSPTFTYRRNPLIPLPTRPDDLLATTSTAILPNGPEISPKLAKILQELAGQIEINVLPDALFPSWHEDW